MLSFVFKRLFNEGNRKHFFCVPIEFIQTLVEVCSCSCFHRPISHFSENSPRVFNYLFKKSLIIHKENTKNIIAVKEFLCVIKNTRRFSQNFASIFSAYTTSILKMSLYELTRCVQNGSFFKLFKMLAIRAISNHSCILNIIHKLYRNTENVFYFSIV